MTKVKACMCFPLKPINAVNLNSGTQKNKHFTAFKRSSNDSSKSLICKALPTKEQNKVAGEGEKRQL